MRLKAFGHAALIAGAVVGVGVAAEGEARACGGCFHPPTENDSVITDHRMIFAISSQQTTLWDQIRWQGSPNDFAWVLPVSDSKVATLGLSADIDKGYADARTTGLQLLATAKAALGELSRIEAVVKLLGMVNAEPDFGDHPKVINGCSDLFVEVLGAAGQHARSAVGMGSLPNRMTVEIEAIFLVTP